jgi:hypothetical protein
MAVGQSLGILVSSDKHFQHLIGLARAAVKAQKQVLVFLTHRGVLLTQEPGFAELTRLAKVSVCKANFQVLGLQGPVPGLSANNFTTQASHGLMIQDCDRYITL